MISNIINKIRDSLAGQTDHPGLSRFMEVYTKALCWWNSEVSPDCDFWWPDAMLTVRGTAAPLCLPFCWASPRGDRSQDNWFPQLLQVTTLCCISHQCLSSCGIQRTGSSFAALCQNWVDLFDLEFYWTWNLFLKSGKSFRASHFVTYIDIKV